MSELTDRRRSGHFDAMGLAGELSHGETLSCCHCFVAETKILTTNGVKNIARVEVGDSVMDNSGDMTAVTAVMSREASELRRIGSLGGGEPLFVTEEHPIWTVRAAYKQTPHGKRHVTLSEPEFVKAGEVQPGMWVGSLTLGGEMQPRELAGAPFDDDVARFVGLYLAEGCIGRDRIEFGFHKKEVEYIDFVRSVAKSRWGANCSQEDRKNSQAFKLIVNSAKLETAFLAEFGRYAFGKKFPFDYLLYPRSLQESIIGGLLDGDGYYTKDRRRRILGTVSPHLAYQSAAILHRLGYNPSISSTAACVRRGVNHQKSYKVMICVPGPGRVMRRWFEYGGMRWVRVTSNERIVAKAQVFNLTTASHTFVANGFATHNCGYTWILQKGSGKVRGFCTGCMRYHCGGADCWECVPYERRIENIEAGRPELTPCPVLVTVPELPAGILTGG